MNRLQRYVSDELTHFVGFNLNGDEDKEFFVLKKILKDKKLFPSGDPTKKTGFLLFRLLHNR